MSTLMASWGFMFINELSIKRCHCERSVAIPIFFKAKT